MISDFFINRIRFAMVVSIVISIVGGIALLALPVQQYPNITPPTVNVSTSYPGASAETIADVIGGPIESAVNGVDDMSYMSSTSSNAGQYSLAITFRDRHRFGSGAGQCAEPGAIGDLQSAQ